MWVFFPVWLVCSGTLPGPVWPQNTALSIWKFLSLVSGSFLTCICWLVLWWTLMANLRHISRILFFCCSLLSGTVNSDCLSLHDFQLWVLNSRSLVYIPYALYVVAWKFSKHKFGYSWPSLFFFMVSQGPLTFTAWCPMSWKLWFYIFCLVFSCFKLGGGSVKLVHTTTPFWLEA